MLEKTLKNDDLLIKSLDLRTIQRLICYTDKGMLCLQIRKGEQNYHLTLDSVPLPKEQNAELMALLFPIPKQEIPTVNKINHKEIIAKEFIPGGKIVTSEGKVAVAIPKRGRPVGSARTK